MPDGPTGEEVLAAASLPWAFSQAQPLGTSEFCREAEKRGIGINEPALRELWRVGALIPFVEVRERPVHNPKPSSVPEPTMAGTYLQALRRARDTGRLIDPNELGYRPQLRFLPPKPGPTYQGWWNGLLYTRWQLIELHDIRQLLSQGHVSWKNGRRVWRSRNLDDFELDWAKLRRRRSTLLVALDPRYLPAIEHGWVSPVNTSVDEWDTFAASFDPVAVLDTVGATPDEVLGAAERLLLGLHRSDPLGQKLSELIRRAPRRRWEDLSGDALAAIECREAGEVLLLAYEEMAERGQAAPLSERMDLFQAEDERISYRRAPLDVALSGLGISPHPGVVVVVEGETEEFFVSKVRDHLRIPRQAEVVQSVVLRGVGRDMTKLAAFASAPLIEREEAGGWLLVKPPTRLMVVVDPDKGFKDPHEVEKQKRKIVDEIVAVVRAQGVDPEREEIESLVEVTTWKESCFEFEHFTDLELADALLAAHDCGGLSRERLIEILAKLRSRRDDIKQLWANWKTSVGKIELAEALWPVLQQKLDAAASDVRLSPPSIADRLIDAFQTAAQRPHGRFLLKGVAINVDPTAPGGPA